MKWIKQIFGIKSEDTVVINDDRFKNATPTSELVVKVNNDKPVSNIRTEVNLKKLTKSQLEDLAKSELGIELDKRQLKSDLIKQILDTQ
tara:strand:+ start:3462 stop:3728 length:267 start_codon:yes stop_codon:yes gene_type:complete